MKEIVKVCTRCVMDTSDPHIYFDIKGVCNHCYNSERSFETTKSLTEKEFLKLSDQIKIEGKDEKYDCIIGLSGGVDSSYLALILKETYGLRPLAVHLDNGWNSKLATKNIFNIVKKLDIGLHTHVIEWEEFKDLQKSYIKASVVDIEALTDHAITSLMYQQAKLNGIKYILDGTNSSSEAKLPVSWRFNKADSKNIKDIHNKYGKSLINTFPLMTNREKKSIKKSIYQIAPLDYVDYNKETSKKILIEKLNWKDYGGKHHESIFTRFYQGYILPKKFNIDKRKSHLSSLIYSNQISREEALKELNNEHYPEELMNQDIEYVIKKLDLSIDEFNKYINSKPVSHFHYQTTTYSKIEGLIHPKVGKYYDKLITTVPFIHKIIIKLFS